MPLQRDKAKQLHARRNFRPHPRVTPKAIVRERIDTVRKKGIYLLPNLFTLSSLFSGFYAVIIAMAGDFEKAAIAIFVSMILDGCDGRVARLTHTQSSFGVQFDSLADMCAFGMAPAMVVYQWALHDLGRLGWAAAFVYCAGAALRLARFNANVDVVDKGDAQDRSAAPVGCLDDLATLRPAFAWQGQEKGNADAEKGGAETEQDELSVPDRAEIRLGQVHEQQRRQQCLEHELVQFPGGVVVQQVYFFHQTAEYHHQKYGNGGV